MPTGWVPPNLADYVHSGDMGHSLMVTFESLADFMGGGQQETSLVLGGSLTASTVTANTITATASLVASGAFTAANVSTGNITASGTLTVSGASTVGHLTTAGAVAAGSMTSGGSPVVVAPQAGTASQIQSASVSGTTNGSGKLTISFPSAFSTTAIVTPWMSAGLAGILTDYIPGSSFFTIGVRNLSGSLQASTTVTINYIAHAYT